MMRIVLWATLAVALVSLFLVWRAPQGEPKPGYVTHPLERGDLLVAVSASGTIAPSDVVEVGAQVDGMIQEFGPDPEHPSGHIDYGSRLQRGDVLARIDDAAHQGNLAKAQAALKLSAAEVRKARAQLGAAESDWKRAKDLKDNASRKDLDHAFANYNVAQADLAVAEAELEQAGVMENLARINLNFTVIRSPIDGVVIDRRVDVGQTVVAGFNAPTLFLLAEDLSKMQIRAAVNEADIAAIQVGQKVYFGVDAYPGSQDQGRVSEIRLNASIINSVVTYDVIVDIDNADGHLLPYMTATLRFVIEEAEDVFRAPSEALKWRPAEGGDAVWVLVEGEPQPLDVETGITDGLFVQLTGAQLREGLPLILREKEPPEEDFSSTILSSITGG